MLGLADIDLNVLALSAGTDDHSGVNLVAGADEELSSLLCIEESVGNCLS